MKGRKGWPVGTVCFVLRKGKHNHCNWHSLWFHFTLGTLLQAYKLSLNT